MTSIQQQPQHGDVGKSSRIPELDGLRGLAILAVLLYHYTNVNQLSRSNGFAFYVQRAASAGWSGVDLFFVLSGFLIGGILLDARRSQSFFRTFYIRRFFRIIPIYYSWIILYIVLVAAAGASIQARSFSGKFPSGGFAVYAHFFFLQNVVPINFAAVPGFWGSWFGHLWSLAVEEQFYLAAPLMIAWLTPRRLTSALIAIACCAPLLRTALFFHQKIDMTHVMPCRADDLALGILIALAWRSVKHRNWLMAHVGLLYITAGLLFSGYGLLCWYAPSGSSFALTTFGFTWVGLFYALLLTICLAGPGSWLARFMRVSWLREAGRVSYCMYIVHLIIALFFYAALLHRPPEISTFPGACVAAVSAIVTYAVARISWSFLERPLIQIGHEFKYSTSPTETLPQPDLVTL